MKTAKTVFSVVTFITVPVITVLSFMSIFIGETNFNDAILATLTPKTFATILLATAIVTPLIVIVSGVVELCLKKTFYGGYISGGLLLAMFLWYKLFFCKAVENTGVNVVSYLLFVPGVIFFALSLIETVIVKFSKKTNLDLITIYFFHFT